MVRPMPIHLVNNMGSIPLAIGLFLSLSALVTLCAKGTRQNSKKYSNDEAEASDRNLMLLSPLLRPKQLITTIANKATKRSGDEFEAEEGFEEGGLWQKAILMGEKCQPLEFSGVIYYDPFGNQISEMPPRPPMASPLHI